MLNLATLAVEATSTLHLKGADDELLFADEAKTLPVTITLHSPGSEVYAAAAAARDDRSIARMKRKGAGKMPSSAELRGDTVKFYAACTIGAANLAYEPAAGLTGEPFFEKLYADRSIGFVADQVAAHLGDWANFTKSSATS